MCSDFDYNIDYPNIVFQNNKMKVLLPKKKSANPLKVRITPNNQKQSECKPKKKRCISDANAMAAAIESVTKDEMNVTEASKVFNVPRQRLDDWLKGKFRKVGAGRDTELTADEEEVLVKYCLFMANSSYPLSVAHIKAFAWAIVKKSSRESRFSSTSEPTWKWWRGFRKRHPEVTLSKPDNFDRGRSRMNNQTVMDKFFLLYKILLDKKKLIDKPSHIFNADESGVDLNSKVGKVVVKTKSKHAYSEQKSIKDHITTMICCSASGLTLSPMIIFEKSWPSAPYSQNDPDGCLYAKSPNRYVDEELFLEWFKKFFIPETNHLTPTLLVLDGHGSHGTNTTHLSFELISLAKEENIHILLLPPHTTNILQPLDVGIF